ncbi:hypothetical protein BCR44DRAFT_1061427 [Catenaria anguillulae PL171]|uniref:Uncharacterized protein n=1 Tax=Catenaria anguillulae PL171 TaxID=765915 RepID=A0A1Y2HSW2_9FUNG|nr:hypothetical protein BCR44DRAFT_1061427 [Catenaria anguillulae PL171]
MVSSLGPWERRPVSCNTVPAEQCHPPRRSDSLGRLARSTHSWNHTLQDRRRRIDLPTLLDDYAFRVALSLSHFWMSTCLALIAHMLFSRSIIFLAHPNPHTPSAQSLSISHTNQYLHRILRIAQQ